MTSPNRFPLIAAAIAALPIRSCVIDGEAIACDENGLSVFELLRYQRRDQVVTLCAFDLLSINGDDLRSEPIEERKSILLRLIPDRHPGIVFNAHYIVDGAIVFKNACALGCEGIMSKRLGSPYQAGRSPHWIKVKNPDAPAVTREAEEDWGSKGQ
jgi:ATP-dependent DNA ligase